MRDPERLLAKQRRFRQRKHEERFGLGAGDMRGRHGNHAAGSSNGRFNPGRLITSQGYVLVRVSKEHHRAFGPPGLRGAYAYEHDLIAEEMIGRRLHADETAHHRNGQRDDNRHENLEVVTRADHAREHGAHPGARDTAGRFKPGRRSGDMAEWSEDLRVREMPR